MIAEHRFRRIGLLQGLIKVTLPNLLMNANASSDGNVQNQSDFTGDGGRIRTPGLQIMTQYLREHNDGMLEPMKFPVNLGLRRWKAKENRFRRKKK